MLIYTNLNPNPFLLRTYIQQLNYKPHIQHRTWMAALKIVTISAGKEQTSGCISSMAKDQNELLMKKMLLITSGVFLMLTTSIAVTQAVAPAGNMTENYFDWIKSKTSIWAGMKDGKIHWYKLDKNAQLWWSADGKKWTPAEGGMWADKDGKWLKIGEGKLWWTADKGKNFSEVPEWKWEGPKGEWYKFDAKWTLWVNSK